MNIININSTLDISQQQIKAIELLIFIGERNYRHKRDSFLYLKDEIPIFLLNENTFNNANESMDYGGALYPPTEYFGFYTLANISLSNKKAIYLCPERILNFFDTEIKNNYLLIYVIFHLLSQAKMNTYNYNKYEPKDEFFEWMEKPFANLITLRTCQDLYLDSNYEWKKYDEPRQAEENDLGFEIVFDNPTKTVGQEHQTIEGFAWEFVYNQPNNYKLGASLVRYHIWAWWEWSQKKSKMQNKEKSKSAWIKFTNKNIDQLGYDKVRRIFASLYSDNKKIYFTHSRNLFNMMNDSPDEDDDE
ncbi:MAG: hypothetical protein NTW25_11185 [Candidatus Kapabacteria bacterium]|nr:hypothetical protein [Candidatus Kapabacteria bacterium]